MGYLKGCLWFRVLGLLCLSLWGRGVGVKVSGFGVWALGVPLRDPSIQCFP